MNMTDISLFFSENWTLLQFANITNALYQQYWTSCYLLWKNIDDSVKTCYSEVNAVLAEAMRVRSGFKIWTLDPVYGQRRFSDPLKLLPYFAHWTCSWWTVYKL